MMSNVTTRQHTAHEHLLIQTLKVYMIKYSKSASCLRKG